MTGSMRLAPDVVCWLRCPCCGAALDFSGAEARCTDMTCVTHYPVVDGIPILINERASVFTVGEFVRRRPTYFAPRGRMHRLLSRALPRIGRNIVAKKNYALLARELVARSDAPVVLVVGGGVVGEGMAPLLAHPSIRFVETDVALESRTMLICDAHDIPFADAVFDGVIAQAVLEHVTDPNRCVAEIHRVLKADGLVYAETPFMQQVHGGRYDFTRFTHLGHRRLFRHFAEIESGAVGGPGMALAWSLTYFLLSFTGAPGVRRLIWLFSRLLFWPLKLFDQPLIRRRAALDAAAGCYFLGRKAETPLTDRDLIGLYRGAF